ncbi:hypothetical protein NIES2100_12400 [Calothrix sp. NIES-2100]|nr:hypothetical protein NIES2100_12400 [Calothrix sp. NIES-2100]
MGVNIVNKAESVGKSRLISNTYDTPPLRLSLQGTHHRLNNLLILKFYIFAP